MGKFRAIQGNPSKEFIVPHQKKHVSKSTKPSIGMKRMISIFLLLTNSKTVKSNAIDSFEK